MKYLEYDYYFEPRFRDTDAYMVIHHSNYFCYFEEARYHFSEDILCFPTEIMDPENVKFPVLKAECTYRIGIKYDFKKYCVHLKFRILDQVKIEFVYRITNPENELCAEGRTIHAFVKPDGKMCLNIPEWFNKNMNFKFEEE